MIVRPVPEPIVSTDHEWRGDLLLVGAAALLTGILWMTIVPPFEGTDELYFYNRTRQAAARPERRENLFFRLGAPIIRLMSPAAAPAAPEYNPAFAFVSNEHGEVNRFVHDRPVAPREHVRTLAALRGLTVLLAIPTALIVYAIARLSTGRGATALAATGLALAVPQWSFINSVVHAEAITRLFAGAVTLLIVARAVGAVPRWIAWVLLPLAIATVPLADRQALFVAPLAVIGLIATESTLRARAFAAAAIALPAAAAVWLVMNRTEAGTDLGRWIDLLRHPIRPFVAADPTRGSIPPTLAYYAFEFLPKMFMGFWGWLGQPSILLPAWVYAVLGLLTVLAAVGLIARLRGAGQASGLEARRLLARRIMAAGIVMMWVPIVYGPALMGLNLWYGRWLFPMIGPILLGLVLGIAEFARIGHSAPRYTSIVLAIVAGLLTLAWLTSPGATLRAAITANHYGDRARLIATVSDFLIVLALATAAIAAVPFLRIDRRRAIGARAAFVAMLAANLALLVAFVRPLYAPMSPGDYVGLIGKYIDAGDTTRAANLYASAVRSYPQSRAVRTLADATPRLLLGGESAGSRAVFWQWLARGRHLADRDALLMLAHEVAADPAEVPPAAADALQAVIAEATREPELHEAAALLHLTLDGGIDRGDPDALPIESSAGRRLGAGTPVRNGEIILDGYTVHSRGSRGTQLIVYFRPRVDGINRRLWIHAYPGGSPPFQDLAPTIPPVWKPGALAWAAYDLPPGRYGVYFGLWVGGDIGDSTLLGAIP
jgi:hypothetical protein